MADADFLYLEEQHEAKRRESLNALEALEQAKRQALVQLQKTQIVFKYLNWKQREYIESRINNTGSGTGNFSLDKIFAFQASEIVITPEEFARPLVPVNTASTAGGKRYLQRAPEGQSFHYEAIRKNILLFGAVQAGAAEISEAIAKTAAVFKHRHKTVCRELFPWGFISRWWRSARRFFNRSYYSWQDMGCLLNLGIAAGFVLKMAEAPIVKGRI